tara:strand:- start:7233 stop:8378 length:1146 start_codon:yes stop_codon:yes gene_type:complete
MRNKSISNNAAEISWFAPICNGDDQFLGDHDPNFKSSWENTSKIVLKADKLGFRNILCPSSYQVGQDTMTFASAIAPLTKQINLLTAIRSGEIHPPMLARSIATLDHILKGRLTLNIISSDLPGTSLSSELRYQRSNEVIQILKQGWNQEFIDFKGDFYNISLPSDPVKPYQQNGGPLLYFGGYSPQGVELCAQHCDVYLMWPETISNLKNHIENLKTKSKKYNRELQFGLRVHVIVRETEDEAKEYANKLISHLDIDKGNEIRNRALDSNSYGVSLQSQMRNQADNEYYIEDNLWTGVGLARSGCGSAIVGNPDQVYEKLKIYMDIGIRSFILSGYPHSAELDLFSKYVLPKIQTFSFPQILDRIPKNTPSSPLAKGNRN